MHILRLIVKEILHRKAHFLLGLAAVTAAVALCAAFASTAAAGNPKPRGSCSRPASIASSPTPTDRFLINGFSDHHAAEYLGIMARQKASLQPSPGNPPAENHWRGMEVILSAWPPVCPPDRKKPPMVRVIKRRRLCWQHSCRRLEHQEGDSIVSAATLQVTSAFPPPARSTTSAYSATSPRPGYPRTPGPSTKSGVDCLCFVPAMTP